MHSQADVQVQQPRQMRQSLVAPGEDAHCAMAVATHATGDGQRMSAAAHRQRVDVQPAAIQRIAGSQQSRQNLHRLFVSAELPLPHILRPGFPAAMKPRQKRDHPPFSSPQTKLAISQNHPCPDDVVLLRPVAAAHVVQARGQAKHAPVPPVQVVETRSQIEEATGDPLYASLVMNGPQPLGSPLPCVSKSIYRISDPDEGLALRHTDLHN
jgi:hypothetical protein